MIQARAAIFGLLSGDATLTGLLATPTSIYFQMAPQSATFPLVTFHRQSGRPRWFFAGDPVQDDLWTVLAATTGSGSAAKAEQIAEAIDDVLNGATLGGLALDLRRESDVQFADESDGTLYRRAGATYRLYAE